jgi:acetyl esterase
MMDVVIDEGAQRVLDIGSAAKPRPFESGSAEQARRDYNAGVPELRGELHAVASIDDRTIDGPNGPIAIRIYRGVGAPHQAGRGLLYLHGGGWVIGNLESHDEICRWFANSAACTVVCPDYRLAPEHKFPAGLEDCVAALAFMTAQADAFGVDCGRIAVAGDSAGGNLAAVVALMSRAEGVPAVAAHLLLYPNTDASQTADSYRRFAEGFGLSATTMRWFRDHYIRTADDIADWRVSPLRAKSLAGAPPAFVAIAGKDILADEGTAYAERLRVEGVSVVIQHWPTQIHGFASMGKYIAAAQQSVEDAVAAWRGFEAGPD